MLEFYLGTVFIATACLLILLDEPRPMWKHIAVACGMGATWPFWVAVIVVLGCVEARGSRQNEAKK